MWKKCNTIHMCAFLGMQNLKIKLILVLKGGCIPLDLFKGHFWDCYKKSNISFEHFC